MAVLRRRPGRPAPFAARRRQHLQCHQAAADVAMETLGDTAQGSRHHARTVRGRAADDRRRAVCHHALQQHRGARRRNRQRTVALRRGGLRAWTAAVGQRLEAARHRGVARRAGPSPPVPQQPPPALHAGRAHRQASHHLRQRRRGAAEPGPAAPGRHHPRLAELAAGDLPQPCDCRQPGARSRAAARSPGLRAGVRRPHRTARLVLLHDPSVGERPWCRDVGERVVAPERPRQRVGADGPGRGARAAVLCRRPPRRATITAASVPGRTSLPSRSCAWTPPPVA